MPILLHGHEIQITTNLYAALHQLASDRSLGRLWVDAICIDQTDDEEKNWQVVTMGSIYKGAHLTVAWLGPSADDSDRIMAQLNELSGVIPDYFETRPGMLRMAQMSKGLYTGVSAEEAACKTDLDSFCRAALFDAPLQEILGRPYWFRAWVIQEYTLSGSVEIACGPSRLSAHPFERVIVFLHFYGIFLLGNSHLEAADVRGIPRSSSIATTHSLASVRSFVLRRVKSVPTRSMLHSLIEISGLARRELRSLCSDPKDYIFSIAGLASDGNYLCSKLDYRKTWQDTFIMTALSLTLAGHSVLMFAGLQESSDDLPSCASASLGQQLCLFCSPRHWSWLESQSESSRRACLCMT